MPASPSAPVLPYAVQYIPQCFERRHGVRLGNLRCDEPQQERHDGRTGKRHQIIDAAGVHGSRQAVVDVQPCRGRGDGRRIQDDSTMVLACTSLSPLSTVMTAPGRGSLPDHIAEGLHHTDHVG